MLSIDCGGESYKSCFWKDFVIKYIQRDAGDVLHLICWQTGKLGCHGTFTEENWGYRNWTNDSGRICWYIFWYFL